MKTPGTRQARKPRLAKAGRPTVGIRELKAHASAIIDDVKERRLTYAVTKRGEVEALIVPVDVAELIFGQSAPDGAWDAWQALVARLSKESGKKTSPALDELERMRR